MRKVLILLVISILTATSIRCEEVDDFSNEETTQFPEESNTESVDEKILVKRQLFRRPAGIFGLLSSLFRPPSYNYQRRPQINNYQQNQYYRPQQTFPQFGAYQQNYYNQQRPQYYNYQQNPYQRFNFIDHLNKLPRNSETFGYYLDPYHGRRLPENERHLWGPSEAYRESLRGQRAIFYYRGYKNFVSKIGLNPHRGVKMYVENVGNIPGF